MKLHEVKSAPVTSQADEHRVRWQLVAALVLAIAVMALSVKSCPDDVHVRATEALHASA